MARLTEAGQSRVGPTTAMETLLARVEGYFYDSIPKAELREWIADREETR